MMAPTAALAACIAVSGPTITAGHLAQAVPGFVPANPSAVVAYAPEPGVRRVFPTAELRAALNHLGYQGDKVPADACFARPVMPVSEEAAISAMRATLGAAAHIEIVELSQTPAPEGEVVFPREGLGVPPIAFWRGYVKYDGEKKFPVWARLKLSVPVTWAMATEFLKANVPIRAGQIVMQTGDAFPEFRSTAQSAAALEGMLPRRSIQAGTPVWDDSVEKPPEVGKGDRVAVTVLSGRARMTFDAEAQSSGRVGESIYFKNPESGKLFRARVSGRGAAAIETPAAVQ